MTFPPPPPPKENSQAPQGYGFIASPEIEGDVYFQRRDLLGGLVASFPESNPGFCRLCRVLRA